MPAGPSSRSDTELTAATLLSDRYRLDAVLGQGGVGTVWRARDLQLDRDVAVKQLQSGVASDPAAAERFRREATTAASLSHPSLVTIYDVGEDARQSLGTYIILDHILRAARADLPYVYLGYWVEGSQRMDYKAKFKPMERLGREGWRPMDAPETCVKEDRRKAPPMRIDRLR